MATTNNLGRVQGGGFFGSTSTSTTSITKTTVQTNGVSPLVGDTIINANGDCCRITAITDTAYVVTKYGSIKGGNGTNGKDGTSAGFGTPSATATELNTGSAPTVSVEASGNNDAKVFKFNFGIPTGAEKIVTINGSAITMAQFVANCEKGVYTTIGTTATIAKCINGRTYTIRLIGTNHDQLHDESLSGTRTYAKTTWEFVNLVGTSRLGLPFDYMDYDSYNESYWPSNMQGYVAARGIHNTLNNILCSLPAELQRGIKFVSKQCHTKRDSIDGGSIGEYTYDDGCKLFLLSATEIGAGASANWAVEGTPYSYYSGLGTAASTKRVKAYNGQTSGSWYWLRSPRLDYPGSWYYIDYDGSVNYYDTNSNYGVAPAFCI